MDAYTKLTDAALRRTLRNYVASTRNATAWWGQANPEILAALHAECQRRGLRIHAK